VLEQRLIWRADVEVQESRDGALFRIRHAW
jgi:hypothetical protein